MNAHYIMKLRRSVACVRCAQPVLPHWQNEYLNTCTNIAWIYTVLTGRGGDFLLNSHGYDVVLKATRELRCPLVNNV